MRRFGAIVRTAAVETMSQPLSAILFSVAALAVHLLPALQYHRFGAPGRLARETGLSALFVFGLLFAVPAAVRAIGRELETGTAAAALALGVSRSLYFCARLFGVLAVFAVFFVAIFAASAVSAFSCVKAASVLTDGGVARVWGPTFAVGVCGALAPFAVAACLNRFFGRRFCLWTCLLVLAFQLPGLLFLETSASLLALLPAYGLLAIAGIVYVAMAGTLATRLNSSGVTACMAVAVLAGFLLPLKPLVPDMRLFWLGEGDPFAPLPFVAGIVLAALWTVLGCLSLEGKELP